MGCGKNIFIIDSRVRFILDHIRFLVFTSAAKLYDNHNLYFFKASEIVELFMMIIQPPCLTVWLTAPSHSRG